MSTAIRLLQDYLCAIEARNIDSIENMSHAGSLFEIPFLKPNRLVGTSEIVTAHREVFANLEAIDFSLIETESSDCHAIGEGRLSFTRSDGSSESLLAGIVAETEGEKLVRISLYCDARNHRLWSDKTIM